MSVNKESAWTHHIIAPEDRKDSMSGTARNVFLTTTNLNKTRKIRQKYVDVHIHFYLMVVLRNMYEKDIKEENHLTHSPSKVTT